MAWTAKLLIRNHKPLTTEPLAFATILHGEQKSVFTQLKHDFGSLFSRSIKMSWRSSSRPFSTNSVQGKSKSLGGQVPFLHIDTRNRKVSPFEQALNRYKKRVIWSVRFSFEHQTTYDKTAIGWSYGILSETPGRKCQTIIFFLFRWPTFKWPLSTNRMRLHWLSIDF